MANRPSPEEAQVGIGTMIVFIATVLVAAVAAGVLIDMSGKLQERSTRTGTEATESVSSNLFVEQIVGKRDATTDAGLKDLEIYIALAPGAREVDLELTRVQLINDTSIITMNLTFGAAGATTFSATEIRDVDNSFNATSNPTMNAGDLIRLNFDLEAAGAEYEPRAEVRISLIPEVGNSVNLGIKMPNSYGQKTVIALT